MCPSTRREKQTRWRLGTAANARGQRCPNVREVAANDDRAGSVKRCKTREAIGGGSGSNLAHSHVRRTQSIDKRTICSYSEEPDITTGTRYIKERQAPRMRARVVMLRRVGGDAPLQNPNSVGRVRRREPSDPGLEINICNLAEILGLVGGHAGFPTTKKTHRSYTSR